MSIGVTRERYNIIISRYEQFIKTLDNFDLQPVKVFDPLSKKQIDELELIRDVSKYLQNKKDEDIRSQKQDPVEPAEAEKVAEVKETEEEEEKEKKEN